MTVTFSKQKIKPVSIHGVVEWQKKSSINNVVVIPAIAEYENIRVLLNSLLNIEKNYLNETLFLFVVNNSDRSNKDILTDNKTSLNFLRSIIKKTCCDELSRQVINTGLQIGLVDSSSAGNELPDKIAGVGAARKIGMDISLSLFDYNSPGKKLIISLDADCVIEKNYLNAIVNSFAVYDIDAAILDYSHCRFTDSESESAITWYEITLRYYSLGLLYSRSEFSFHSIGSTIVCTDKAYLKAGGMNYKKAAEDFYFLQKLAKRFPVYRIYKTKVLPSARESWRVPFGTGKSMSQFLNSNSPDYLLYNPGIFIIIRKWLNLFYHSGFDSANDILTNAGSIHPGLFEFLEEKKFSIAWKNILSNCKTSEQLNYQKKNWFDGFKTLKLIHYLRDRYFPPVNMYEALDWFINELQFPVISRVNDKTRIEIHKFYLDFLKAAEKKLLADINKNLLID